MRGAARPAGRAEPRADRRRWTYACEPLPGGPLGWRSRVRYAVDAAGRPGLLQHRSHQVVADRPLPDRPPGDPGARRDSTGCGRTPTRSRWSPPPAATSACWPARPAAPLPPTTTAARIRRAGAPLERRPGRQVRPRCAARPASGACRRRASGRCIRPPRTRWSRPSLEMLQPAAGEIAWDLYGGAGLFAAALAERTGARTTVVESAPAGRGGGPGQPGRPGRRRGGVAPGWTSPWPGAGSPARSTWWCSTRRGPAPAPRWSARSPRPGRARSPTWPATRRRWPGTCATFPPLGWRLAELRAFDCFPMTQHVECVALLLPVAPVRLASDRTLAADVQVLCRTSL